VGNLIGGSAWAMARDIGEGFLVLSDLSLRRLSPPELDQLGFELDRRLREVRGEQAAVADSQAARERNRRIQRLTGAVSLLHGHRTRRPRAR
jgi:hypothetical protein